MLAYTHMALLTAPPWGLRPSAVQSFSSYLLSPSMLKGGKAMRAKLLIIALTIITTGVIVWLDYSHSNPFISQTRNVKTLSQTAPNFTFKQVDRGASHSLSSFKGKTVLINFWASWCGPCLYEYPALITLATEHADDLVLLMVSSDKSPEQAYEFSRGFCMQRGMANPGDSRLFPDYPNIMVTWDKGRHITRELFGTTHYPESILIGPNGTITHKYIGVLTEDNMKHIKQQIYLSAEVVK